MCTGASRAFVCRATVVTSTAVMIVGELSRPRVMTCLLALCRRGSRSGRKLQHRPRRVAGATALHGAAVCLALDCECVRAGRYTGVDPRLVPHAPTAAAATDGHESLRPVRCAG